MKNGLSNEYVINLSGPYLSTIPTVPSATLHLLSTTNSYVAGVFIPPYTMQVNRIAVPIYTSGVQVIAAGMTTDSGGLPAGSGGALSFINSGSTAVFTNTSYSNISFTTTTLNAGQIYFMAAQTKVHTSRMYVVSTMSAVCMGGVCEFPYNVTSGTATTKQAGISPMIVGFNNGNYTQWFGAPNVSNIQTLTVNDKGFKAGCKFRVNSDHDYLTVSAFGLNFQRATGASSICEIYSSDNSTLIATSIIPNLANLATPYGNMLFQFGTTVILRTNTNYYARIFTTASTAIIHYSRISGNGLTTSPSTNTEYMNAYDINNN
jgi:hypothetical protein